MALGSGDRRSGREPSLGELVALASRDMSLLVRQEIELAKAEMGRQVAAVAIGAGLLGAAAGLALGAMIALTIFLGELFAWAGLARPWSFLLAAVILLVLAGLFALLGALRLRKVRPPKQAISSVKEDIAMLKDRKETFAHAGRPVGAAAVPPARTHGQLDAPAGGDHSFS